MRYQLILLLAGAMALMAFSPGTPKVRLDRKEARVAYELINQIRQEPSSFRRELKLSSGLPITEQPLVWNEHLARAAEKKAQDMAARGYFSHVDPEGYGMNYHIQKSGYDLIPAFRKNKSANNFESIAYGAGDGEEVVRILILDKGVASMGHRNHLLGIGAWNKSLSDIGIGFARREVGGRQQTYISILIAKQNW